MIKRVLAASAALALSAALAQAQEVKVGLVAPYTGIGAEFAQPIDRGMEHYLKLNADEFKPYKIKLIKRDYKNPGGADAKIAVQELLTQDKVDALAGWVYSPNAIASAPIVTAGKKLAVIMNAGTAHITNMSPYYVRTSFSMWHAGHALGEAAAKQLKAKTAVVGYSDFPPGKDSLAAFKRGVRGQRRQGDRRDPDGRRRPGAGLHAVLPARQGQEAGRVLRLRAGRRPCARGDEDLWRARHEGSRHQADRPGRHHPGHQAAGDGPGRRRPHHHASLQCRPRQSRRTSVRRGLEEGLRRRLDAGLHGGRRL